MHGSEGEGDRREARAREPTAALMGGRGTLKIEEAVNEQSGSLQIGCEQLVCKTALSPLMMNSVLAPNLPPLADVTVTVSPTTVTTWPGTSMLMAWLLSVSLRGRPQGIRERVSQPVRRSGRAALGSG